MTILNLVEELVLPNGFCSIWGSSEDYLSYESDCLPNNISSNSHLQKQRLLYECNKMIQAHFAGWTSANQLKVKIIANKLI